MPADARRGKAEYNTRTRANPSWAGTCARPRVVSAITDFPPAAPAFMAAREAGTGRQAMTGAACAA